MNPEQMQPPNQQNPDQSAAALSFATMLSEGLLPKQMPQEGSQEGMEAPPTNQDDTKMAEMDAKIESLKKEMQEMVKSEVSSIKESIQEALKDGQE